MTQPVGPVLVIGCGRSGTVWLAETLRRSAGFVVTIEQWPQFQMADCMALRPSSIPRLLPAVAEVLQANARRAWPDRYVDKSHQLLWVAEAISDCLPGALFVAIERDPRAVVASMLRHPGVLDHVRHWRRYPVPNRYLGIDGRCRPGEYDRLDLLSRCALRVRSHVERLFEVQESLAGRVATVRYEDMVTDPAATSGVLEAFLGAAIAPPVANSTSLDRWAHQLSRADVATVERIMGACRLAGAG